MSIQGEQGKWPAGMYIIARLIRPICSGITVLAGWW